MAAHGVKQIFWEKAMTRTRQPLLAVGFAALAVVACGCAGESAPAPGATRVLRPEEVKITIGESSPTAPETAAPATPAEGAGSAP